jgi:outer membrane protein TolC
MVARGSIVTRRFAGHDPLPRGAPQAGVPTGEFGEQRMRHTQQAGRAPVGAHRIHDTALAGEFGRTGGAGIAGRIGHIGDGRTGTRRNTILASAVRNATQKAATAAIFALALAPPAAFAQDARPPGASTVTLAELLDLARARSPRLHAATAAVDAARSREASAGLPPDPVLTVGAMNLSVPGFSADMPTSMAPAIEAMQMLPFPGKLGLRARIAEQETSVAATEAGEAWWGVRTDVATAFYELYAVDRRIEAMRETLGLLGDSERIARAMYAAGTGRQSDVLRAGVELARMQADLERMEAMRTAAAARLNALLDRPTETPVPAPAFPPLPLDLPDRDTLRAWAEASRPLLEGSRLRVDQARTRSALARKEIWPDLSIGVQYGQRRHEMGTERMAGAMVGFSVPIFAARRQLRMREEAAAMERMAIADLAERRAAVDARITELVADLERTRTLIELYRGEVLPQADANVEAALAAYRAGTVDFLTLIDAQMSRNAYLQELHALMAEYGIAAAELEMTVGRELPATGNTLAEVR